MDNIKRNFPSLNNHQLEIFGKMKDIYADWNAKINVISRKDFDEFYVRHVLHSLAIAKFISFPDDSKIIDIGSGGGFPGVPLAVMFPNAHFTCCDSIGKKIKVIEQVSMALNLKNISTIYDRSENVKEKFHYMTARAVTKLPDFVKMTKHLLAPDKRFLNQGLYYLKGGDISLELKDFSNHKLW